MQNNLSITLKDFVCFIIFKGSSYNIYLCPDRKLSKN